MHTRGVLEYVGSANACQNRIDEIILLNIGGKVVLSKFQFKISSENK